jgi:hypothetical protein
LGVLGIVGSPSAIGVWRPTPLVNAFGAGPQFATMTPLVLRRPSQFRPVPPPALTSPTYTTDYNETKTMGAFAGSPRTDDQSELALFWAGNTPLFWNRIALQIATARGLSFSENAHLFAQMNLAMGDAVHSRFRRSAWDPDILELLLCSCGNRRCASLRRHPLSELVRARKCNWSTSGGLRDDSCYAVRP